MVEGLSPAGTIEALSPVSKTKAAKPVSSQMKILPNAGVNRKDRNRLYLRQESIIKGVTMNLRCAFCQTPYTISRNEMLFALQKMDSENLSHYDAHCPRCRRVTQIPRQRLEMAFPNWRQAVMEAANAPAPAAPVPAAQPEQKPAAVTQVQKEAAAKKAGKTAAKKTSTTKAKSQPVKKAAVKPAAKKPAPKKSASRTRKKK